MNNLQFEFFPHIYENIFGYLNVDDLLNVRLVCRRFNELLMKHKLEELVFYNLKTITNTHNWFFTNQPLIIIMQLMNQNYFYSSHPCSTPS